LAAKENVNSEGLLQGVDVAGNDEPYTVREYIKFV
jgi:hypothetical protein